MPEHGVDAFLIAVAAAFEERENVLIDPDGDRLLLRRRDEHRLRPVEVERHGVAVLADRRADLLVGQRVDGGPVSFSGLGRVARDDGDISAARRFGRGGRR